MPAKGVETSHVLTGEEVKDIRTDLEPGGRKGLIGGAVNIATGVTRGAVNVATGVTKAATLGIVDSLAATN
jgi:hypothetical protein